MNARSLIDRIAEALGRAKLEAILVGNAAAALHGAPVTTLDFDFMFRKTPVGMKKLKAFARELDGAIFRPYYPASDMFRVVNDDIGLQVDFLVVLHGVSSFESLRKHATPLALGRQTLLVASLPDIIRSKRAANRPKDLAVLDVLQMTLDETNKAHPI